MNKWLKGGENISELLEHIKSVSDEQTFVWMEPVVAQMAEEHEQGRIRTVWSQPISGKKIRRKAKSRQRQENIDSRCIYGRTRRN